jgi:peptidoglycan/xylan/chitin deacetylase (PgdA/CDA1 family)
MINPLPFPSPLTMGLTAFAAGTLSGTALLAYSVFAARCQFWAPVIRSIPQRDGVALTFDDGPHPEFTPRLLDILAERGVTATFFVIGRFAQAQPALLRRMIAENHVIGNHSLDHDRFGINQRRPYWRRQLAETQRIVADITGVRPVLFRPPMGFKTGHIAAAAREERLPIVGWSLRSLDTRPMAAERLAKRVVSRLGGHDILLMHDGVEPNRVGSSQQQTLDAVPRILEGISEKSLRVVPLIEALLEQTPELSKRPAGVVE